MTFSPLRCGAFVATATPRSSRPTRTPFSPLRCGAFVATQGLLHCHHLPVGLSVPYGAGRSLRRTAGSCSSSSCCSFSPLRCGAFVATAPRGRPPHGPVELSVPYGAGRSLRPRSGGGENKGLALAGPGTRTQMDRRPRKPVHLRIQPGRPRSGARIPAVVCQLIRRLHSSSGTRNPRIACEGSSPPACVPSPLTPARLQVPRRPIREAPR